MSFSWTKSLEPLLQFKLCSLEHLKEGFDMRRQRSVHWKIILTLFLVKNHWKVTKPKVEIIRPTFSLWFLWHLLVWSYLVLMSILVWDRSILYANSVAHETESEINQGTKRAKKHNEHTPTNYSSSQHWVTEISVARFTRSHFPMNLMKTSCLW